MVPSNAKFWLSHCFWCTAKCLRCAKSATHATSHRIRDTAACDCTCHSCIAMSGRKYVTMNACLSLKSYVVVVVVVVVVVIVVAVVWPLS